MTNLLISYGRIPWNTISITPSSAVDQDNNEWNLLARKRWNTFEFAAASVAEDLVFDLGASTTDSVDHLIVANARNLDDDSVTVTLDSSPDDIIYTTRITETFGTLVGPQGAFDSVQQITETAAFRFWRLTYAAASTVFSHGQVYFGTFFDFDIDPSDIDIQRDFGGENTFRTSSGNFPKQRFTSPRMRVTATWKGITDVKADEFFDRIAQHRFKRPVFLFPADDSTILEDVELLHARITEVTFEKAFHDFWIILVTFEELIG